jgi:hypothetical protein
MAAAGVIAGNSGALNDDGIRLSIREPDVF